MLTPISIGVKSIMVKRHSRTEQLRHIEAWQRGKHYLVNIGWQGESSTRSLLTG
jgi:hypothetical protein